MRGAFLAVITAPALALAQSPQQIVRPPIAQYWMSVETAAGMSLPGMPAMMPGTMGGAAQGGRRMVLQLGSQNPADSPQAEHAIPAGLNMGPALPLATPLRPQPVRSSESMPGNMERPKGRMLVYWGCGDDVRPGQPVVLDFAKIADGQMPPNMAARRIASPAAPAPGRHKTYGDWPNPENAKSVPEDASLRGDHAVKGNYSPEIRFSLGESHDFMERVALSHAATRVQWKAIPQATGYFATLFGAAQQDEVVFWSSSEVQEMGGQLMDYVPPAEVARLVREKVVLAPSVTQCAVPAEVVQKAGGTPFFNFIAYGPEANFAQPPRPSDPKVPWELVWTAKARFKSTASLILGESARPEREATPPQTRESQVEEGIKALRGIFGR